MTTPEPPPLPPLLELLEALPPALRADLPRLAERQLRIERCIFLSVGFDTASVLDQRRRAAEMGCVKVIDIEITLDGVTYERTLEEFKAWIDPCAP